MTPRQLGRRARLLARSDAAISRWPAREGSEFVREMTEVASGLEALVAGEAADGDALERFRTWRHAGNAYFDLGSGRERAPLERAAAAFRRAEALLPADVDPVETLKLNYSLGQTLLQLSRDGDARLASEARNRFAAALALAKVHMPEGVPDLERGLATAEPVAALLQEAGTLGERIERIKRDLLGAREDPRPVRTARGSEMVDLFGVLNQAFEKEKVDLEPTRRTGLEDFMKRLGDVVQTGARERSLGDMLANRGKLDTLIREIQAQGKNPSLKGPGAPARSREQRLLAALQELKMFVWTAGMQQSMPRGMREAAIGLFPRIGRLTTWISEAGGDSTKVRQLEADQARGLASEVRLFARRAHLMLVRPIWPVYTGLVEPNRIFFSGPASARASTAAAATALGLGIDQPKRAGADFAEHRWNDLRAANVAVFDLSGADPQVYYELGIALAVGAQLSLVAAEGTQAPFDVAQDVRYYAPLGDVSAFMADELDSALYSLHVRGADESGLAETLAYAERLAADDRGNAFLGIALRSLRDAGADAAKFHDALNAFRGHLGPTEHEILVPRWPGAYPNARAPRCFAVMPFREEQERAYAVVAAAARRAGLESIRGDLAEGQQIVRSIWEEICRATHVTVDLSGLNLNVCLELGIAHALGRSVLLIARAGTEEELRERLPGVAKWRCHIYHTDGPIKRELGPALDKFFGPRAAARA
jgi:hypothetical protein